MQDLPDGTDWLRSAPPQNEVRAFRRFENGKINHLKPLMPESFLRQLLLRDIAIFWFALSN
jgi:hypothetical protein